MKGVGVHFATLVRLSFFLVLTIGENNTQPSCLFDFAFCRYRSGKSAEHGQGATPSSPRRPSLTTTDPTCNKHMPSSSQYEDDISRCGLGEDCEVRTHLASQSRTWGTMSAERFLSLWDSVAVGPLLGALGTTSLGWFGARNGLQGCRVV
jgi:hypothetical protein